MSVPPGAGDARLMAVIEVTDLGMRYGSTVALDGVSLRVEPGEIFGVVGSNGAGKTTLVECVAGLRTPDAGVVRVLGLDPCRGGRAVKERIGVQLQESRLPDALRVGEALQLYASFYDQPADWRVLLDQWGLTAKRGTGFGNLSGGQKQRLLIALALVGNPELALLDEVSTGLDLQARRSTWDLVRSMRDRGVTVVLVTHHMDEVERLCDRVAVMRAGRVVGVAEPHEFVARTGASTLDEAVLTLGGDR
ncbi:ABC transporter ATP-binding protein [Plantactinospora mayteni]